MTRRLAPFAAFAAAATLGLAACGGGDETATTAATTEPPPATTTPPPPPPPPPPTTTEKREDKTVTIVYRDGKVAGGIQRQSFKKGDTIVLVARSDVPEELHVHGYDKSLDLTPGKTARLAFVATLTGGFEVELEERGLQVAELTVSP